MKSSLGIYVVLSTVIILKASATTPSYLSYSNSQLPSQIGHYPHNQWNAGKQENNNQVLNSYNQPSQDWAFGRNKNVGQYTNLSNAPKIYLPPALGSSNQLQLTPSTNYNPAVASSLLNPIPVVPSIPANTPSDSQKFKIFPISLPPGANTIRLPISGVGSKVKVVHIGPQNEVINNGVNSGLSSDTLEALSRAESAIEKIESNSGAYGENKYIGGYLQPSQQSSSAISPSSGKLLSDSNYSGGPKYDPGNNFQTTNGILGINNNDALATIGTVGNSIYQGNMDNLYLGNNYQLTNGYNGKVPTDGSTSNSQASVNAVSNFGYPSRFSGGSVSNYLPNYGNQGLSAYNNVKALDTPTATLNEGNTYGVNKYPQEYLIQYEAPVQPEPSHNNGASTANPGYPGIKTGSNPLQEKYDYPQTYGLPVQQGTNYNNADTTATASGSSTQIGSNSLYGRQNYPEKYRKRDETIAPPGTGHYSVDATSATSSSVPQNVGNLHYGNNIPHTYGSHDNILSHKGADGLMSSSTPLTQDGDYTYPGNYYSKIDGSLGVTPTKRTDIPDTGPTSAISSTASQNSDGLHQIYNNPETYGKQGETLGFNGPGYGNPKSTASPSTSGTQSGDYSHSENNHPQIYGNQGISPSKGATTTAASSTATPLSSYLDHKYDLPDIYHKQSETLGFDGTGYDNPKSTAGPSTLGTQSGDYSNSDNNHPQIYGNQGILPKKGATTPAASNTVTPSSSYLGHKYDFPDIYSKLGGIPHFEEAGYNLPKDIAVLSNHGAKSNNYPYPVNNFPQLYVHQGETSPIQGTANTNTYNTDAANNSGNLHNKYDNPEPDKNKLGSPSIEEISNGDPKNTDISSQPETQNMDKNDAKNNYPRTHVSHGISPIFGTHNMITDKTPAASSVQSDKVGNIYNIYYNYPKTIDKQDITPGYEGSGHSDPKDKDTISNYGSQGYHDPQTYDNKSVTSTSRPDNTDDGTAASSTVTQNEGDAFPKYYYPYNYGKQTIIPSDDKTQNPKDTATLGTSEVPNDSKSTPIDYNSGNYYPQNIYQNQDVDPTLGNDNGDKDATDISSSATQNGDETSYGNKYPNVLGEPQLPPVESDTGAQTMPNSGHSLVYPLYPDKTQPLSAAIDQEEPFETDGDNDKTGQVPASFYPTQRLSGNFNKNPSDLNDYNNAADDGSGTDSDQNYYHAYPITSPQENSQSSSTFSQGPDSNPHSHKMPIPTASNHPKPQNNLHQLIYKHPTNPDRKHSESKPGHEILIHGHGSPHNPTKDQQAFNYEMPSDSNKNGKTPSSLYQMNDGAATNPSGPNDYKNYPGDGSALPQFPYSDDNDSKPYSTMSMLYPFDNAPASRYPASHDSDSTSPQENSQSSSTSLQDPDSNAHSHKLPIPTASNHPKHQNDLHQLIYKHPTNPDRKQSSGSSKTGHEIPIHGHGSSHSPTKDQQAFNYDMPSDSNKNGNTPSSFYQMNDGAANNPTGPNDYKNHPGDGSALPQFPYPDDNDSKPYSTMSTLYPLGNAPASRYQASHGSDSTSPQENSQSSSTSLQDPDSNSHSHKLPIPTASNNPKHQNDLHQLIYKHPTNPDRKQSSGSSKPGHEIPVHVHGSSHSPTKDQQAFNYDMPSDSNKNGKTPSSLYQMNDGAATNPSGPNDYKNYPGDGSALPQFPYSDDNDSTMSTLYPLDNAPASRYPGSHGSDSTSPQENSQSSSTPLHDPDSNAHSHKLPIPTASNHPKHQNNLDQLIYKHPTNSDRKQSSGSSKPGHEIPIHGHGSPHSPTKDQQAFNYDMPSHSDKNGKTPSSFYQMNDGAANNPSGPNDYKNYPGDGSAFPQFPYSDDNDSKPYSTMSTLYPLDNAQALTFAPASRYPVSQGSDSDKPLDQLPIHKGFPLDYPWNPKYSLNPIYKYPIKSDIVPSHNPRKSTNYFPLEYPTSSDEAQPQNYLPTSSDDQGAEPFNINDDKGRQVPSSLYPTNHLADSNTVPKSPNIDSSYTKPHQTTLSPHPSDNSHAATSAVATSSSSSHIPSSIKPISTVPIHRNPSLIYPRHPKEKLSHSKYPLDTAPDYNVYTQSKPNDSFTPTGNQSNKGVNHPSKQGKYPHKNVTKSPVKQKKPSPSGSVSKGPSSLKEKKKPVGFFNLVSSYFNDPLKQKHTYVQGDQADNASTGKTSALAVIGNMLANLKNLFCRQ